MMSSKEKTQAFFETLRHIFDQAVEKNAASEDRYFHLGSGVARIRFATPALITPLTAALAHLAAEATPNPDVTLYVWDDKSAGTTIPKAPWPKDAYKDHGRVEGFNDERFYTYCSIGHLGTGALYMMDAEKKEGLYWINDAKNVPVWEQGFPFRDLFQWALDGSGVYAVHGGAVGSSEGGLLITGPSGSGKSTTTLTCLDSGLLYAGDDFTLVTLTPEPYVYSLYSTARLVRAQAKRLPELFQKITNRIEIEEEKELYFLHEVFAQKMTKGFPLKAIVLPKVMNQKETTFEKTSSISAVKALAPSTLFQLRGSRSESLSHISKFAQSLPVFDLNLGTDLKQIPEVLKQILKSV